MRYIDAGYAVALGVLVAYGAGLLLRRTRLERVAARRPSPGPGRSEAT